MHPKYTTHTKTTDGYKITACDAFLHLQERLNGTATPAILAQSIENDKEFVPIDAPNAASVCS